jgi:hypothetical protein
MPENTSEVSTFRFGLNGLVSKESPELLGDGQYRYMSNFEVIQEGAISTIAGRKALGNVSGAFGYMIRKMVVSAGESPITPATNPRYVGINSSGTNNLYRTFDYITFVLVALSINSSGGKYTKAFSLAVYAAGEVGGPWAFIASENKMLKDSGANPYTGGAPPPDILHNWGILPARGVAAAVDGGSPGNLDGGASASPNNSTAYDWRYTWVSTDTNNEGNPSQTMLSDSIATNGVPLALHLRNATVTVWGTADPQIGFINIYRRGGILFDNWRLVGTVTNPGVGSTTFTDNIADVDIVSAPILVTDNDPPISSMPPTPITGSFTAAIVAGGFQTINISPGHLVPGSGAYKVQNGTLMHIFYDSPEDVIINVVTDTQFTAYFQHTHLINADFEIDVITNQPANLAISYQQFVVVSGDPNNPQLLYRSKGDQPEAFTNTPADGTVSTVACGTPGNPVVNMTEFRGLIVTLNKSSIFETVLLGGSFTPAQEVAYKGLVSTNAWCKTPSEIWFLAADGVYSWDGGTCRKRSEAIDPIFHGEQFTGMVPLDYGTNLPQALMQHYRNKIYLYYIDATAQSHWLVCEPAFNDRWHIEDRGGSPLQFLYTEPDTQTMVGFYSTGVAVPFYLYDQTVIAGIVNETSDLFTGSTPSNGNVIQFDMRLPWIDLGKPQHRKYFEEVLLELDNSNSTNGTATLSYDLLLDYSDTAVETLTVPITQTSAGRLLISLLPNMQTFTTVQSFGWEGRALSYRLYGNAFPVRQNFYSITVRYNLLAMLTAGGSYDWMNLGYKYDKKLYVMTIEFDVAGINQSVVLDTVTGPLGKQYNPAVQTFTLSNPTINGAGRAMCSFPIIDNIIAKEVRVRPIATAVIGTSSATLFKIFNVDFQKEDYPADIVAFTNPEDGGYEYDKYCEQVDFMVNTNNTAVTVQVQADGVTVFTGQVQTTEEARRVNLTMPAKIIGKMWRLFIDPAQGALTNGVGMFQLWSTKGLFKFQPADQGEVVHTTDWDSLGHPYDKYLITVTFTWDLGAAPLNSTVTMQLDTINGINGQTPNPNVMQFVLGGTIRGKRTYALPIDTIAKLVQIYPVTTPAVAFKNWKYEFQKIDYPADTILSTPWKDAATSDDKNPSWVWIDADTAGVQATVSLQNENGSVLVMLHTGTLNNRKKLYAIPVDTFAKNWRLTITIGVGGKFQLFDWGFARWQPVPLASGEDPPDQVLWAPWNDFGYPYEKLARNLILTVDTGGQGVQVNLVSDEGALQSFIVNTTYTTRRVVFACNPEQVGTLWRLINLNPMVPKFKLWEWALDYVKEPASVTQWTSYNQAFGYPGWKYITQVWVQYKCAASVTFTIVSDTGTFTVTLPPHTTRSTERFYPGTEWGAGLGKSKIFTISFSSSSPVKMYADASGIEWVPLGIDRRSGTQKIMLSEFMTIPI